MTENPFVEPGEQDRTVLRPMPGGGRAGVRRAAPVVAAEAAVGPELEAIATGTGPLAVAAAPLLQLLARLRNTATAPDPGDMRERTRRELRAFERRARAAGVALDQMRLAHYALCATLDDVVLNTPWGSRGRWRDEPLAVSLHADEAAGRGFFEQLRTLREGLPGSLAVMEVMFVCLCLGMMGPYRTAPDGAAQLERVRHQVFGLIDGVAPGTRALGAAVAGVRLPAAGRGGLPVWVVASAALGVVVAVYVGCLASLNAASDGFYAEAAAAAPAAMPGLSRPPATPPPPPPPEPAVLGPAARLQMAFADLAGVEVIGTPAATIVRIAGGRLFTGATATLSPGAGVLLERVGRVIGGEKGGGAGVGVHRGAAAPECGFPVETCFVAGPGRGGAWGSGAVRGGARADRGGGAGGWGSVGVRWDGGGSGAEPADRDRAGAGLMGGGG